MYTPLIFILIGVPIFVYYTKEFTESISVTRRYELSKNNFNTSCEEHNKLMLINLIELTTGILFIIWVSTCVILVLSGLISIFQLVF